jgi:hypothetical protein
LIRGKHVKQSLFKVILGTRFTVRSFNVPIHMRRTHVQGTITSRSCQRQLFRYYFLAVISIMQIRFRRSAFALATIANVATLAFAQTPPASPQLQGPPAVPSDAPTVMACVDGRSYQCSGTDAIRTDNGVILTGSGVQVYGNSTSDLAAANANVGGATGMALASGGVAEMRIAKDANFAGSNPALILNKLGIKWDDKAERPTIIETFQATQGRTVFTANGTLASVSLPDPSNLGFYDFATKGTAATQANYANNRYFPRMNNPPRCGTDTPPGACPTVETAGVQVTPGDWRTVGAIPDETDASRLHEDGDVHAGNGKPGANGQPTVLPDASGVGVPFPGSKGFRDLRNLSYQYANLAKWLTQDAVGIPEWGGTNEHNQNRRGIIAYGDVTSSASVPDTGTTSYPGFAYGWYARTANEEPVPFFAGATVTIDFATRQVAVAVANAITEDAVAAPLAAINFNAAAGLGANGSNVANYLAGPIAAGTLTGGLGGRLFGPGVTAAPAEVGTVFSLADPATGAVLIGGIIARRR